MIRALVGRCQPAVAVIGGDRHGSFAAGWQAAQRIAAIVPTLPLVMLTADDGALHEVGLTPRGRRFAAGLRKPFRLDALIAAVAGSLMPPHAPPTASVGGRLTV